MRRPPRSTTVGFTSANTLKSIHFKRCEVSAPAATARVFSPIFHTPQPCTSRSENHHVFGDFEEFLPWPLATRIPLTQDPPAELTGNTRASRGWKGNKSPKTWKPIRTRTRVFSQGDNRVHNEDTGSCGSQKEDKLEGTGRKRRNGGTMCS